LLAKNFKIKKSSAEVKISNLINYSVVYCQNDKNIRIVRGGKKKPKPKILCNINNIKLLPPPFM